MLRGSKKALRKLDKELQKEKFRMNELEETINNIDKLKQQYKQGFTHKHKENLHQLNDVLFEIETPKTYWSKFRRLAKKIDPDDPVIADLKKDDISIEIYRNAYNRDEKWYVDLSSSKCRRKAKTDYMYNFDPDLCVKSLKEKIKTFEELMNLDSKDLDQYLHVW